MLPLIIEKTGKNTDTFDIRTKLYQNRIIYLDGDITQEQVDGVIMQMLYLDSVSSEPITLYINSAGGSVVDGLALKDCIYNLRSKVNTVGIGKCASMGAYLLACGTGTRRAMQNCRILLHTVSTIVEGNIHDFRVEMKELELLNKIIFSDLEKFTNSQVFEEITHHDCWLSSEQAKEYNLIDEVI